MSGRAETEHLRERLAGKWQIPLLLTALALLVGALVQQKPPQARLPLDTFIERIAASIDGRMYDLALADADDLLAFLLEHDRKEDAGPVYLLRARALSLRAQRSERGDKEIGLSTLSAYQSVRDTGQKLAWTDLRNEALAHEWLEQYDSAVASYERACEMPGSEQLELRKRIIELKRFPLKVSDEELQPAIDEFITAAHDRPDLLHWAVTLKTEYLAANGRGDDALELMESLRPSFESTEEREQFEYLIALTLYRAGRYDEAEAALRSLRNRLVVRTDVDAMAGWLLGRVVLNDGGPQRPAEALSFFRDVLSGHAKGLYVDASRLGMGEALAALERYDESLDDYRQVIDHLHAYPESRILNADVVRTSMTVVAHELRQHGKLDLALAFLEPATALLDAADTERLSQYLEWLGSWRAMLAASSREEALALAESEENAEQKSEALRRTAELFTRAAETFAELAHINTLSEPRSAAAIWRAAELFDEAGDRERTISVLREFVRERPSHSVVPRALLRLGQSLQAVGRYQEAVEAYQENFQRFPRTPDANNAMIPLAQCYIALGPEHYQDAEDTLRLILDDSPIFTPDAPEFADALYLLGDLLSRQTRYEDAIPLLVEAMQRYPDDRRMLRAEFLLADAYRQSGLALREDLLDASMVGQKKRLEAEYRRRLEEAAELFSQLIRRFEGSDEDALDELRALYLCYARLYEADCWFELGQYERALKNYERAAWIYRDTPSALAAYVQIISCHSYLGNPREARAALRRAQYLVRTIPEQRFADGALAGSREEWEQYFRWQEQSDLF